MFNSTGNSSPFFRFPDNSTRVGWKTPELSRSKVWFIALLYVLPRPSRKKISSIVFPIISSRVHPNTPSAELLYSIILLKPSAITIASMEPATVASSCLEEPVSASVRFIADSSIRSIVSNKPVNITKKEIAKPPVHVSCLENFIRRTSDRFDVNFSSSRAI